ncbi:MAG TPA: hypothetical protein VJ179_00580 [Patescibacteria group bacterium]|nr:hypothetical protein [Patescibacteria group bacterium]
MPKIRFKLTEKTGAFLLILFWIAVLALVGWYIWYKNGFTTVTTLKIQSEITDMHHPQFLQQISEGTPMYSPDKKHYFTLTTSLNRKAQILTLYDASNDRVLGTYSFRELVIYGWDKDSSGVFVANKTPGDVDYLLFFQTTEKDGPIRKILVP